MKSLDSSPRWRTRGWAAAALFTSCLALAPIATQPAHAAVIAVDSPAIETVDGSTAPAEGIVIDETRRTIWRSMMCGIARFISKIDPGFGDSASMICSFIESMDGN
jgi:hypothetical protein